MQDRSVGRKISINPIALSDNVQEVSTQFDYGKTKVTPGGSIVQTKLDNIQDFPRIDLIKIDVEGMEYNVLKGAQNTIAYFRPILFIEMQDASLTSPVFDFLICIGRHVQRSIQTIISTIARMCLDRSMVY